MYEKSRELFAAAKKYIPGGVNSPVRAFGSLGGEPLFLERGEGSRVFDADGNSYIDYVGSYGPLILGHAHPRIVEVIKETAAKGTSFGAPTRLETELARLICEALPQIEVVRMVNSGTEAVMSAVRLARGFTKRQKIVKFAGCYHGHADSFLIKAGSGVSTLSLPDSPGVTPGTAADTIALPYNDLEAVKETFARVGDEVAAVILEPVAGNMGLVLPKPGFLEGLREITDTYGALLIFDEVMTGFRVAYGGAQEHFGIKPDLTTLGKVIGGGLPVGAYGGRRDIMEQMAPGGPIYQAGTLSGNPLAMAVGIETLNIIKEPGVFATLTENSRTLSEGIRGAGARQGVCVQSSSIGSMFGMYLNAGEVHDYDSAASSDQEGFKTFFWTLLKQGVYVAPSQFEAGFMSLAHSQKDIEDTLYAVEEAFAALKMS